ncbi:hypothetical protein DVH24_016452 [Malus domestica]|uniref:Uncharacterized protein n=1 Tax=Malus domestica TaxID=3750 RepID=A0A498HSB2_MALDO|nr:hypothetical protein DVH24_016452 [Malus domestica]
MGGCMSSSVPAWAKGKTRKSSKQKSTGKTVDIPEIDEHSRNEVGKGDFEENGGLKDQHDAMDENGSLPDGEFAAHNITLDGCTRVLDTISEGSGKSDATNGPQKTSPIKEIEPVDGGDKILF